MGQFSERIAANEDQQTRGFSKKRKYESNLGSLKSEKDKQLKLFEQKQTEQLKNFQEEIKNQQEAHQQALEAIETLWKQKLHAVEANREALVAALHKKDTDTEQSWEIKMRSLQEDYQAQIMQLHELLNAESVRLSDARTEINSLSHARKSDLVGLKGRMNELLKTMEQKERDYAINIKLLQDQFTSKEEDYKSQIRTLKSTQQMEIDHLQNIVHQLEAKLSAAERDWTEGESQYQKREAANQEFIQSLRKEIQDVRQEYSQRELEWRFWGQRCHKLEKENAIIRNEMDLLANEERRLREVSVLYEAEIARLDNIVYGSSSNSGGGGGRTSRQQPSRSFQHSGGRLSSK